MDDISQTPVHSLLRHVVLVTLHQAKTFSSVQSAEADYKVIATIGTRKHRTSSLFELYFLTFGRTGAHRRTYALETMKTESIGFYVLLLPFVLNTKSENFSHITNW